MRRRALLSATASLPTVALAGGCLGSDSLGSSLLASAGDDSEPVPESHDPVRGESDAIETRVVEDDDTVEYLPEEDAVRYVAAWRRSSGTPSSDADDAGREPVYETTPLTRWVGTQVFSAASRAAADHANEQLDTDDVSGGVTSTIEGRDRAAVVTVEVVLDRDGNVEFGTDVEFESLVAATPTNVSVTYAIDGREFERDVPIWAEFWVIQQT
jgi:hypothetical protein